VALPALFVNGVRRPRTRLPKQGEYRIESLPGYTGDFLRSPTKQFIYAPDNIVPTWTNLRDVDIVGITRWLDNRLPIESVHAKTRTVTFDRPSLFALVSGNEPGSYWVENVFEAWTRPANGTWIARAGYSTTCRNRERRCRRRRSLRRGCRN
jgi:hypothetical protein